MRKTRQKKQNARSAHQCRSSYKNGVNGRCIPVRFGDKLQCDNSKRAGDYFFITRNGSDSVALDTYNLRTGETTSVNLAGRNHVYVMQYLNGYLYILHNDIGYEHLKHYITRFDNRLPKVDDHVFITSYCIETGAVRVVIPEAMNILVPDYMLICGDRLIIIDEETRSFDSYDPETNLIVGDLDRAGCGAYDACGDDFVVINSIDVDVYNKDLQYIRKIGPIPNHTEGVFCFRNGMMHHEFWNEKYMGSVYKYVGTFAPLKCPEEIARLMALPSAPSVVSSDGSNPDFMIYGATYDKYTQEMDHDSIVYTGGSLIHVERSKKIYGKYSIIAADHDVLTVGRRVYFMREWSKSAYALAYVGMGGTQLRMFRWTVAFLYWVFHYQLGLKPDIVHYIMRHISI